MPTHRLTESRKEKESKALYIMESKQDRDYKKKQVENNEAEVLRKEREAVEKRAYLDSLLKPEAIDLGLSFFS